MKHLTLDDIKIAKPDFHNSKMPKGQTVTSWLIEWIKHSLDCGIADIGDFIPSKEDLASYLNVSTATVQNSIRQVKNLGYFSSKQSIGTCIADFYSKDIKQQDELYHGTLTECKIKKIVLENGIKLNNPLPSIKELVQSALELADKANSAEAALRKANKDKAVDDAIDGNSGNDNSGNAS